LTAVAVLPGGGGRSENTVWPLARSTQR